MGLELAASDVAELRTEGWAAGLQLAGLSLRGRADRTGFITSFGGEDGAERLAELDRENLFVDPLDSSRQWYRYHHL